ncbi:MAG: ABC transporter ATP-binding protein [Eubacterium sp.]|nr:ABC transporter ATP-binding protein [Eubacterium sp.]
MIITARDLKKDFIRAGRSAHVVPAVRPLNLTIRSGEMVGITGRSGSGKSTLLNMLAGILTPTSGKVLLDDTDLYALDEKARARLRCEKIGLIPQGHTALRSLSVLENVLLPSVLYSREQPPEDRARELMEKADIASLADAGPGELSGGELRRMAVARALLMDPAVVLADEPTAGLDRDNTLAVMELLRDAARSGAAVLVVTHEEDAVRFSDRVCVMDGGKLEDGEEIR